MLFVVSAVLFDMLKARQLACVSKSGQKCPAALSLSSWRAWIEMCLGRWIVRSRGRSPHGERGLKCISHAHPRSIFRGSLSSWRAWIEITSYMRDRAAEKSLSSWRAWIEIQYVSRRIPKDNSRSPHGERGLKLD